MKKIFVIILLFCLFVSCADKRGKTIKFLFEPDKIGAVRDSLVKFNNLTKEYFNMHKKEDTYKFTVCLSPQKTIWFDEVNIGKWSDFEANKNSIFNSNIELNLVDLDKKGFFTLLKFLNDNFIAGIHYYPKGSSYFYYCGEPFFRDMIHKYIVLKSEFYAMPQADRIFDLTLYLITDDKEGMLLLSDKDRVFSRYYFSDKNVPEKWRRPTDEIFHK